MKGRGSGLTTMRHCGLCRRYDVHFPARLSALFAALWPIVVGVFSEEIGVIMRWWCGDQDAT